MNNNNVQPAADDRGFILRVIRTSLILLAIAAAAALVMWIMRDSVRFLAAKGFAAGGNYEKAISLVEDITNEDTRKDRIYYLADDMYNNGLYAEAGKHFEELGDFRDSADRREQCSYDVADELYKAGRLEEALEAFIRLGDFGDSYERQRTVSYELACELYEKGEYSDAVVRFLGLGEYGDSADMAYKSALAITGDENGARAIISSGGVPVEEMEMTLLIAERRAVIDGSAIDAGARHTVLRHADGTVSACGDNSSGQCDVKAWRDITQICAGAYHTVGLRSDGTVAAAGDNTYGQCDVSEWKDIVAIAVSDNDTIGLTAEGTVLSTGYHEYPDITSAVSIRTVHAGAYSLVVQSESGTVLSSHESCRFTSDRPLNDVAVNTGYYAAAQAGGRVISSLEKAEGWKNIACIDGGPRAIVAADVEGKVYSLFFRQPDEIDFSSLADVCQCAAGTEHYVFLTADGTVYAFGDNTYGQCDVDSLGAY